MLDQRQEQNRWPDLYTIVDEWVPEKDRKRKNRLKNWEYGYDKKFDIVIISKDGTLGEIYDINGVKIGLPSRPKSIPKGENKWVVEEISKELGRVEHEEEWRSRDKEFKSKHIDYITREWDRRDVGHWFMNNGTATYLTGSHYMYLTHTKIDVGHPDFREANRIFFIYWEACKADDRCFGMIYLKIRRSGFSFMGASESVNIATTARDSRVGMLSKTGADAKKLFTDKVVPININYPFFFSPVQSGMDRPKTELLYQIPAKRITKKNMYDVDIIEDEGLDTSIDWKNTDDNSYDGEKLIYLLHDESSKWEKPTSIKENWRVTQTCLRLGKRIIGKCMMGSTCNALAKGGQNFKDLYEDSDPMDRSANGRTKSGLYRLFIPFEWNAEGFIDEYGMPVFETPNKPVMGVDGDLIEQGAIPFWMNETEALKHDPSALNEYLRQNPRTEQHAFRDESTESIFNLTKIYDQIEYNENYIVPQGNVLTRGSFHWKNGEKYSEVVWTPDKRGRFLVSWLPDSSMRNKVIIKNGVKHPGNADIGVFGCDPFDISGTVGGGGSKAALHGLTLTNTSGAPSNRFFLEYIARPSTPEEMFDDVIKALHFYGMPALVENNKARLLYHMKNNGYRKFSLNRPDKPFSKLSTFERECGGIPNNSEDVKQAHAGGIATYIEQYVGKDLEGTYRPSDQMGEMFFVRTLYDWAGFDINKRTKYDASISTGLALMAANKHQFVPERKITTIKVGLTRFDNKGFDSERMK